MSKFTVCGFWRDNDQPFCDFYEADTPQEAASCAPDGVSVVGVFAGEQDEISGFDAVQEN